MATRYVRQGAAGANNGTDWTNAYTTLSGATLSRGDVIYVADGSYAGRTFGTANSGTTTITIKKATVADHGTSTGWVDTYGDGQAVFTSTLDFTTGYWIFDGQTGGGPGNWAGPFGFGTSTSSDMIYIGDGCSTTQLSHIEFIGTGSYNGAQRCMVLETNCSSVTLSYYYMHDIGWITFIGNGQNFICEYGYVKNAYVGASHAELFSIWNALGGGTAVGNFTIRYNLFTAAWSTGGVMWDNSSNHAAELRFYGNVYYQDPAASAQWDNGGNGLIGGWSGGGGEDCYNMHVHNNTFIGIDAGDVFSGVQLRFGSNVASNNLFYNVTGTISYSKFASHDYSRYINSGGTHSETNGTSAASGDPFVDYANFDFRLTSNTTSGETLASPYNQDMYGNTRATWTRGAVEFAAGNGPNIILFL
jgi:hypothetical protein